MFRNSLLLSPSKTSAFDQYRNEILTNRALAEHKIAHQIDRIVHKSRKTKNVGVSFNMNANVISYEGGVENFFDSDSDDYDDEGLSIDDQSIIEKSEIKIDINNSEFDQLTLSNTEYNSNPTNFAKSIEKIDEQVKIIDDQTKLIDNRLPQPDVILGAKAFTDVPNYVSIFKYPLVPANIDQYQQPKLISAKGHQNLITDQKLKISNTYTSYINGHSKLSDQSPPSPGTDLSEDSSKSSFDSSSDSAAIPARRLPPANPAPKLPPAVPARQSRSRDPQNNSLDPRVYTGKKTGKINKNVEERLKSLAVDLELQRKSPKRPAPPPPSGTSNAMTSGHHVMRNGHARSTSLNLSVRNNVVNGQRLELCPNVPCRRAASTNQPSKEQPAYGQPDDQQDVVNGRSRFASIRKFLRFDQKPPLPDRDKKFRSLRRFPSPFTKTRVNLAEMRTMFHTERDNCTEEIATDSDVVVTDITEIHSTMNTLMRPNKEIEANCRLTEEGMALLNRKLYELHDDAMAVTRKSLSKTESEPSLYSFAPSDNASCNVGDCHGNRLEEVYDKMTMDDMVTLADVADRFPDLANLWKRSMAHIVNAGDLKFNNFLVLSNLPMIVYESMALYPGALKLEQEFLMTPVKYLTPISNGRKKCKFPFTLPIITEFQDYVPANLFTAQQAADTNKKSNGINYSLSKIPNEENILCKVSILPNVQFVTMKQLQDLQATCENDAHLMLDDQKICFVLIQLIAGLKYLQSQGIEELRSDMDFILIMFSNFMRMPKLCLCWDFIKAEHRHSISFGSRMSLCHFALKALYTMMNIEMSLAELLFRNKFPPKFFKKSAYSDTFQLVVDELLQSKSQSLTRAKSFLEYTFWVSGNSLSCKSQNGSIKFDSEIAAKIWLENERSKQVSNLLKLMFQQPDHVDVVEEYRLQFLLHTTPKSLLEASQFVNFERYDIIV